MDRCHPIRRLGVVASALAILGSCASASPGGSGGAGSTLPAKVTLTERWRLPDIAATRSLFLRDGTVIAAGNPDSGTAGAERLAAIDASAGKLRWSRALRASTDPEAVPFTSQYLRIVAAQDGVFLSEFGTAAALDPIVGYSIGTGERLFPSDPKLEASRTAEELAGATRTGLVTTVGVVRNPATGVVSRLKGVTGTVLAIAGNAALAWSEGEHLLVAYDVRTDQPTWKLSLPTKPTIVVLDGARIIAATDTSWQIVSVADGTATPLGFAGPVDPLNNFDTCSSADYQSVPVGRFSSPIACDDQFIVADSGGRLAVVDLATNKKASIAVCDTRVDPFAVAGDLVACATTTAGGQLSIRLLDGHSGFQLARVDAAAATPIGMAMTPDLLVLSLADGTIVGYDIGR